MKKLLLLLAVIGSLYANAQKYKPTPSNADNSVILVGVSLDSAVKRLTDMGYIMRVVDKQKQAAITNASITNLIIYLQVLKTGDIAISSKYGVTYVGGVPDLTRVLYFKHGEQATMWNEMMKFAGTFQNIEYAKL